MNTLLVDPVNAIVAGYSYFGTIASATTTNGDGVDCLDIEGPVSAHILTGDAGDSTLGAVVKLQESDTSGGTYSDISGATATLAAGASGSDKKVVFLTTILRAKRWVRAVITTTGGGTLSLPIAVSILGRDKITGTGTGYQP